ncbi:hypothetical protein BDEG_25333 [Batrachochytrium dendrobatidis JEL423]|uniref:Uncharacterized protein n=1 Tax=Batrachochytrium dendrobatidis (strain JEL423) TaxID=403673 RepID=A0A177WNV0_BATDL|nr:hypothetical protein BDEG_25333 [Batrachochytrium dendrobatidis JEL423]
MKLVTFLIASVSVLSVAAVVLPTDEAISSLSKRGKDTSDKHKKPSKKPSKKPNKKPSKGFSCVGCGNGSEDEDVPNPYGDYKPSGFDGGQNQYPYYPTAYSDQ